MHTHFDAEPKSAGRLYTAYYHLKEAPFSITPDPEFLYLSETHQSVMEKIHYGMESRMGFMLLTGEVGTGKTTICRALLDQLQEAAKTVYIINPSLSPEELLAAILEDLGIPIAARATKKERIDALNRFLLADDCRQPVVIIIDDAQTMPLASLEALRLLSNLETDKDKLLQMVLVGQPELRDQLAHPQLRQLKQRVAVHCFLDYLSAAEVGGYIHRRLFVAGNNGSVRFAAKAVRLIHRHCQGVPRVINKICDLALTAAYASDSHIVEARHVKAALLEMIEAGKPPAAMAHAKTRVRFRWRPRLAAAVGLLLVMSLGFHYRAQWLGRLPAAAPKAPAMAEVVRRPIVQEPEASRKQPAVVLADLPSLPPVAATGEHRKPGLQPHPRAAAATTARPGAYILQLGSFKSKDSVRRARAQYARNGIETHWNVIDLGAKGVWYRVYTQRFDEKKAAEHYRIEKRLSEGQILWAPWTVVIEGDGSATQKMARLKAQLATVNPGNCAIVDHGDDKMLYLGAFISREGAETIARQIHQHTGMQTNARNIRSKVAPLAMTQRDPFRGGAS